MPTAAPSSRDTRPRRFANDSGLSSARTVPPAATVSATRFSIRARQRRLVDLQLDDGVELLALLGQHPVKRLGLRHGARKTVEDETLAAIRLVDPVRHDLVDDLVGNQFARIHHRLGALADLGAVGTAARSMSPVESCGMP